MSEDGAVQDPRSGRAMGARELEAAHEIAQAFLAANQPIEVYRLALARVTPMVRADFAAVFLRDDRDQGLLRPVCLQGWPQASARYLGRMRIRVGSGPTGRAVADNSAVEVPDIFGDDTLRDWHEPARELGFAAMITVPLATPTAVNGALSFYFVTPHDFPDDERSLLRLISEQLAATTTRAAVLDGLRIENERLRRDSEHLAATLRQAETAAKRHDTLLARVVGNVLGTLDPADRPEGAAGPGEPNGRDGAGAEKPRNPDAPAAIEVLGDLADLLDLRLGRARPESAPADALRIAREAVARAGAQPPLVEFTVDAGDAIVALTTDGRRVVHVLEIMLRDAFRRTARGSIVLRVRLIEEPDGRRVEWTVTSKGMGIDPGGNGVRAADRSANAWLTDELAAETAAALGGTLTEDRDPEAGWSRRLRLPLRGDRPPAD